ncbi:MAG: bifunctional folylpolyglutamate synthase/dihydrofolate synthase [Ectothiorhodospiraceae bacterium]|nr:bifunctional folylpolyglutamate synthase/dihydrofolate synthase [Ectothiorhodospiraceae bacterium]
MTEPVIEDPDATPAGPAPIASAPRRSRPAPPRTLDEWLRWQSRLHPRGVDLGLARLSPVARRLGLEHPPYRVVSVTGTNGKGSCVAYLEAGLAACGVRAGSYTSPPLGALTECVRVAGVACTESALVAAFERVERARAGMPLTPFEFQTLAALDHLAHAGVEVAVLEVGMGGGRDAINVVAAEVVAITTVDVDHVDWLGADRETIGAEKVALVRPGASAVCGDSDPPRSVRDHLERVAARSLWPGHGLELEREATPWWVRWVGGSATGLPELAMAGSHQRANAACAIAALGLLGCLGPTAPAGLGPALAAVRLPGRAERLAGPVERILDVAHNPQAARMLAATLAARPVRGRTLAVLGMYADKDVAGVVAPLVELVDRWFVCGLPPPRGLAGAALAARVRLQVPGEVVRCREPVSAYAAAMGAAEPGDRVVVMGSFATVGPVVERIAHERTT